MHVEGEQHQNEQDLEECLEFLCVICLLDDSLDSQNTPHLRICAEREYLRGCALNQHGKKVRQNREDRNQVENHPLLHVVPCDSDWAENLITSLFVVVSRAERPQEITYVDGVDDISDVVVPVRIEHPVELLKCIK